MNQLISKCVRRTAPLVLMATAAGLYFVLSAKAQNGAADNDEADKVRIGYEITPVALDLTGLNRSLVGLGSYIINGNSTCNDCHTWPHYAPGGDPFQGQREQINTADYLAGGRPFPGGVVSRNLTPDPITGLPAGLTLDQFMTAIHTGVDPEDPPNLLQVMPWPTFRNMSDRDLEAIYEYLSAIPSLP